MSGPVACTCSCSVLIQLIVFVLALILIGSHCITIELQQYINTLIIRYNDTTTYNRGLLNPIWPFVEVMISTF